MLPISKLHRFWVVLEFKLLSKMPFVRKQPLDGSGPEACCSCTRVHGNQRRRLAKLLRPQFGHGCSLCNGAGLCSAPGEALSNPSRLLQKNPWVLFQFFPFVPSLAATSPLSGFSRFWGSLLLHLLGLFGDVSWCLCLPSFSQFTVAPCHVLITSGLFVCLWGVSLRLLPRFIVLLAACIACSKAASVWCLMQVKSSVLLFSQTLKIIRWICCKVFASSAWH